jgi:hypothetical protein
MKNDRVWQAVIGFGPLALCIVYLWNPWKERGLIFDVGLCGLAAWALWQNPFRGRPQSALLLGAGYAAAVIRELVNFLYGHRRTDVLWAGIFFFFAVGWWYRYRHDVNSRDGASATPDASRPEMNHG